MTEKYYSPRWLHQHAVVAAGGTVVLPSQLFANNEVYDWELVFLSIVGTAALDGSGDFQTALGGVARRLRFNVGMSQMGDINLVRSNGHAMLGPDRSYIVHSNTLNAGAWFGFDPHRPYLLPPDTGIAAIVRNDSATNIDNLGCLFMGYEQPDGPGGPRNPVHVAGHAIPEVQPGTQYTMEHADMWNDGEHPAIFTDMVLQGFLINEDETCFDTYDQVVWRINPTTGVQWMPNPILIPVGCICPFNRALFDADDEGPRAYVFPEDTVMRPRQRLSVEVENISLSDQEFDICLFGYLEVE